MKANFDLTTAITSALLSLTSLVVLFSIAPNRLPQQATFIFIGFALYFYFSRQEVDILLNLTMPIYVVSIASLLIVLLLGSDIRGSARWIEFLGVQFQISEFTKPLLILCFSQFINKWKPTNIKNILINLGLFIVPAILIFLEPDLGTTIVYGFFWILMMYVGGLDVKAIFSFFAIFMTAIFISPKFLQDYQIKRLQVFLNPYSDPLGSGYNVIQSMIAIGSGELVGKGLGKGTQSHLQFLPEKHTDFIFASLAEEFGFLGSIAVIVIYLLLLSHLLHALLKTRDSRHRLIILGVFSYLFFQTLLNIGMNLGIAPVTGVTLPLMSSGGSSVLATFLSLSISSSIISKLKSRASIEIR